MTVLTSSRPTFGLRLLDHPAPARTLVSWATLAESEGFDSCWFPHDAFRKNSWALATAAALATECILVGTVGTNPFTTEPSEIATYFATLDELSGGRAVLGLGLHTGEMVEWLGIDAGDVVSRTREAVVKVKALLRGEVVPGGDAFPWTEQCYLRFRPERSDLPVYGGGFGDDYLRMTGEVCDGSLPMVTPPESASLVVAPIIDGLLAAGREPARFDICGCAWLSVAEDGRAARDHIREVVAYFGPYFGDRTLATIGLAASDFDLIRSLIAARRYADAAAAVTPPMLRLAIAGTPAEVIPRLEALFEAGITQVSIGGPLGPDPRRAVELLGREVLPHFR